MAVEEIVWAIAVLAMAVMKWWSDKE